MTSHASADESQNSAGVHSLQSYDEVPYPGGPHWRTHPAHLAMLGRLFGLQTASLKHARVLELGCASGANIIPIAAEYPECEVIGIDLSRQQIQSGQAFVHQLELTNIRLLHQSILEFDERLGTFDYIICHGVFSWVPKPVRDKILDIGRRHLAPAGVMFVSYNTFPGFHLRAIVRDMMKYHVAGFTDPQMKIQQARLLLDFLIKGQSARTSAYQNVLRDEALLLQDTPDAYLFHEHLEETNEPLYFHEFLELARGAELQYLAEADFHTMLTRELSAETAAILRDAPWHRQEQYMDFLRNRTFRATLLCHASHTLARSVPPDRIASFHVALTHRFEPAALRLESTEPDIVHFGRRHATVTSRLTKAALRILHREWPRRLAFAQLEALAWESLESMTPPATTDPNSNRRHLADDLMQLFVAELLICAVEPPSLTAIPEPIPLTTRLVRQQLESDSTVTNQLHLNIWVDPLAHFLLRHCDGMHSHTQLADELQNALRSKRLAVVQHEQPVSADDRSTIESLVARALLAIGANGLLIPRAQAE